MKNTKQIYDELRKSVIGQDEYLKELATISYKHLLKQELIKEGKSPINTNLLVIGPSGCGKTFAAKKLASIIDVPFYEIDCANLVQVGYKGSNNLEDAIGNCVSQYRENAYKAIIYLDEFDKILDLCLLKDDKGKGSQQNFLKYLENNTVTVNRGDRFSTKFEFDTSGLTFIATGSFEMVKDKIRVNHNATMGFKAKDKQSESIALSESDLVGFGYMPELIGRFNRIININQLSNDDFYRILKDGDSSLVKQYKDLLKVDNVNLTINNRMLKHIAKESYGTNIGARGMDKYLCEILDDCLFEVSSNKKINKVNIDYVNDNVVIDYGYSDLRIKHEENKHSKEIEMSLLRDEVDDILIDIDSSILIANKIKRDLFSNIIFKNDYVEVNAFVNFLNEEIKDCGHFAEAFEDKREYYEEKKKVCESLLSGYKTLMNNYKEEN